MRPSFSATSFIIFLNRDVIGHVDMYRHRPALRQRSGNLIYRLFGPVGQHHDGTLGGETPRRRFPMPLPAPVITTTLLSKRMRPPPCERIYISHTNLITPRIRRPSPESQSKRAVY